MEEIIEIRHYLHQNPELSDKEFETAKYIKKQIHKLGGKKWKITDKIGGNGILAEYDTGKEGNHIAFRAELDALPITETTKVEYKSKNEGVAHSCGHDGHMAIVLGLVKHIGENPLKKGKLSVIFQPAEENGQGAEAMMEDDKLKDFAPDFIFAIHNLPGVKKGKVVCKQGEIAAASIGLKITLKGESGHAGHPGESKSPLRALLRLSKKLPQYDIDAEKGTFHINTLIHLKMGNISFGTIPADATLAFTIRSSDDKGLDKLKEAALKKVKSEASKYKLKVKTKWSEWFPAVTNDNKAFEKLKAACEELNKDFQEAQSPFRWSEDFGFFAKKHKILLLGVGAGKSQPPLHQSDYDFPDEIMEEVIMLYIELAKAFELYEK
ncbi:MAG: amidohydrolase [Chitinophagaceae bacterium]|nr:MAG: amidohydrolase [Chitinophagaceae bacterium]